MASPLGLLEGVLLACATTLQVVDGSHALPRFYGQISQLRAHLMIFRQLVYLDGALALRSVKVLVKLRREPVEPISQSCTCNRAAALNVPLPVFNFMQCK